MKLPIPIEVPACVECAHQLDGFGAPPGPSEQIRMTDPHAGPLVGPA